MTDTQTITVPIEQVFAIFRDGAIIIGICTLGWKARGLYQSIADLIHRSIAHMDVVESGLKRMEDNMHILLTNHLRHIEADLKSLSGRKDDAL